MILKKMGNIIKVASICLIFLSLLSACSLGTEKPDKVVSNSLNALKKLDEKEMKKYFTYEELMDFKDIEEEETEDAFTDKEIQKLFFNNFKFKIKSTSIKDDTATVKTDITNLDMKNIMQLYFAEALQLAFGNFFTGDKAISEEELEKQMAEILIKNMTKEDNKMVTTTVDIKLTKKDNKWKIQLDNTLQDAITGGMLTAVNSLDSDEANETPASKLSEIDSYIIDEIWNTGFNDIDSYIKTGKSGTGESLDIDFTLSQLDSAYEEKASYDQYIQALDSNEYSNIKSVWSKLSGEVDTLYNQIKSKKPVGNDANYNLDTGKFYQYMTAFSDEVYDI